MKGPTRSAMLGFGVALAAFAAVSALATISLRSERERNRLLAQYEAERIASGLFLIVAQAAAGADVDTSAAESILRAATYDDAGRVEPIRVGSVPPRIDPDLLQPGQDRFEYDTARRTLTLYRRRWLPDNMRARTAGRRGGGDAAPAATSTSSWKWTPPDTSVRTAGCSPRRSAARC